MDFLFDSIWSFRMCLIDCNKTAFDVPLEKTMVDCWLFPLVSGRACFRDYITFTAFLMSNKSIIEYYIDTATRSGKFSISPDIIAEVKESNLAGAQGNVVIKDGDAIKIYSKTNELENRDFYFQMEDMDYSMLFSSVFGYLLCYTIFKQALAKGITDVDYTIYLNRIKRVIVSKNPDGSIILGTVSSVGDNWWRTYRSVVAIEEILAPLSLLNKLAREQGTVFIHGDLRLDNLVHTSHGGSQGGSQGGFQGGFQSGRPVSSSGVEIIDFGLCSFSINFRDGTEIGFRGYNPEGIPVKYSMCVDIYSLVASFHNRFNIEKIAYNYGELDGNITDVLDEMIPFYVVAYGHLSKHYEENVFEFEKIAKNIRNKRSFKEVKLKKFGR